MITNVSFICSQAHYWKMVLSFNSQRNFYFLQDEKNEGKFSINMQFFFLIFPLNVLKYRYVFMQITLLLFITFFHQLEPFSGLCLITALIIIHDGIHPHNNKHFQFTQNIFCNWGPIVPQNGLLEYPYLTPLPFFVWSRIQVLLHSLNLVDLRSGITDTRGSTTTAYNFIFL